MKFNAITHALISHSIKVLRLLHIGFRISDAEEIVCQDRHRFAIVFKDRGRIEFSIRSSPCIVGHDSYLTKRNVSVAEMA